MNDLIEVNITKEKLESEFNFKFNEEGFERYKDFFLVSYSNVIKFSKDNKLWDKTIKKIIITDNYESIIQEQATKWNRKVSITNEKEYSGTSKILFNYNYEKPIRYIYFKSSLLPNHKYFIQTVISQIITISSNKIIPSKLEKYKKNKAPWHLLSDFVKYGLIIWCPADYTNRITKNMFNVNNDNQDFIPSAEEVFQVFSRKLKKFLFEYNKDTQDNETRISEFWHNFKIILSNLFLRLIEIKAYTGLIEISNNTYNTLINDVIDDIQIITDCFTESKEVNYSSLTAKIIDFCSHFEIFLTEYKLDDKMDILLTKNPKDYFKRELIDTEPRIVCFIDILGFKDMIYEYESDNTCNFLQNIQKAFKLSLDTFFKNQYINNAGILDYLEYKTFSDNIVISIPYFDNQNDFITNLNIIIIFIRGLQYYFMTLGIFIRGGLSIGPYYSDDNILFSKGMIQAYKLEKKALYPRVIVDDLIINKINDYKSNELIPMFFTKVFIKDWDCIVSINPFGLNEFVVSQINNTFRQIEPDVLNLVDNILESMHNFILKQIKSQEKVSKEYDEKVFDNIQKNKIKYKDNEKVLRKYEWLENFAFWCFKKQSKINFEFLELGMNE